MKLIQSILTKNDCYKLGKKIVVKGLMLHSVGCPQPSASTFISQWNKSGVQKCVHGFIEPNGDVYQTLPFNFKGWHGASGAKGSVNATHLGFEMTEPSTIKYTGNGAEWIDLNPEVTKQHVFGTYKTAVELFAYLCNEFKLDPLADGIIISHSEGAKRGIASSHADVEHIWQKFNLTMDQFRQDVKKSMTKDDTVAEKKPTGKEAIEYLVSVGRITSPQEWINKLETVKNLDALFVKWSNDVKELVKNRTC